MALRSWGGPEGEGGPVWCIAPGRTTTGCSRAAARDFAVRVAVACVSCRCGSQSDPCHQGAAMPATSDRSSTRLARRALGLTALLSLAALTLPGDLPRAAAQQRMPYA